MKKRYYCRENEEGFILVTALLIMLVLTIIGIAANRNTSTELKIAGNDRLYKENFYEADGVTELAVEVLEQNIACLDFSKPLSGYDANYNIILDPSPNSKGFWRNLSSGGIPDETNRDFYYPAALPHTNVKVSGNIKLTTGSAIQMAAGYEGLAKGIGTGGATLVYDINVQRIGRKSSETVICTKYAHLLGQEGECKY